MAICLDDDCHPNRTQTELILSGMAQVRDVVIFAPIWSANSERCSPTLRPPTFVVQQCHARCANRQKILKEPFYVDFVYQITSASAVRRELEDLRPKLNLGESEESWDTIAGGLQRLSSIINNGGGDFPEELASGLRSLARPITNAMCSERTRLSGSALDLANTLATTLGSQYELLLPLIFPTLLLLCSRTNKIVLNRARACILTTIESTQLASILTYLHQVIKDKAASLRIVAAEATLACLNSFNPPDLERENRAVEIEDILRSAAKDANPDVRKFSKQIFEAYKLVLPHRLDRFAICKALAWTRN